MRRNLIYITILSVIFLLSGWAFAQDPVGPDTVFVNCTGPDIFTPGAGPVTVSFDIILKTDNTPVATNGIVGLGAAILITTTGAASGICPAFDTVCLDTTVAATYGGTALTAGADPWDLLTTFVPSNGGNPCIFPLTYVLGGVQFGAGLTAGTYTLAHLVLTVNGTGTICIDTTHTQTVVGIDLATPTTIYDPAWIAACCTVTCCEAQKAPKCTVPATATGLCGATISFPVNASDADVGCCFTFKSATFNGVPFGTATLLPAVPLAGAPSTYSGTFTWNTAGGPLPCKETTYCVVFTFVTDCAETTQCTTCVTIAAKCLFARIGEAIAAPGGKVTLPIEIETVADSIGGFTFCIEYDPVLLTFLSLERGLFFKDLVNPNANPPDGRYKWNYLVWRSNPSTVIHKFKLCIVGIGKLYGYGGVCLPKGSKGVINVNFRLSNNELYRCFRTPVIWERLDPVCAVNAFTDCSGNRLFVFDDTLFYNPRICDPLKLFPKNIVENCARCNDGGVTFQCVLDPEVNGDINVNGIPYEIGDAVLFANYFISGLGVFNNVDPLIRERQINATDINRDGLPLSIADLVYLLRILTGDQAPLGGPKLTPYVSTVDAIFDGRLASVDTKVDLGAVWFVFKGEATKVEADPRISGLEVKWGISEGQTKVLVYGLKKGDKITSGSLFTIHGNVKIDKVEAAEYMSAAVNVNINIVEDAGLRPTAYGLSQNYPNPFNASTTIKFALPSDSKVTLKIYNIVGQVVREYSEFMTAGNRSITWDGNNAKGDVVASGVYFYKLTAGDNFAKTLKMTLLK